MSGDVSAELRALSAWVDISLADENHSRQGIAERAAAWARSIAGQAENGTADGPAREMAGQVAALGAALALWQQRDDTKAQPEVRQAANTAMDAIDALLRLLHEARGRLISEMRVSDDATAARVDALLAEAARERQGGA